VVIERDGRRGAFYRGGGLSQADHAAMSMRNSKRLDRKTKISIGATDCGLIPFPTQCSLCSENLPSQGARHIFRHLGRNHCLPELRWIAGEAGAERPFHGIRCSLGLQLPRVRVPGRLRHLIVEIASVCPFFPYMIRIGSFHETGIWASVRRYPT
jgi:hypothetical protein